jgi:hypothetical protein
MSHDDDDDHALECYVCTGRASPTNRLCINVCGCKTTAMHEACLVRLLQMQAKDVPVCMVCRAPYRNVHVAREYRVDRRVVCMRMLQCLFVVMLCVTVGMASYQLGTVHRMKASTMMCFLHHSTTHNTTTTPCDALHPVRTVCMPGMRNAITMCNMTRCNATQVARNNQTMYVYTQTVRVCTASSTSTIVFVFVSIMACCMFSTFLSSGCLALQYKLRQMPLRRVRRVSYAVSDDACNPRPACASSDASATRNAA